MGLKELDPEPQRRSIGSQLVFGGKQPSTEAGGPDIKKDCRRSASPCHSSLWGHPPSHDSSLITDMGNKSASSTVLHLASRLPTAAKPTVGARRAPYSEHSLGRNDLSRQKARLSNNQKKGVN